MRDYRCYFINSEDRIVGAQDVEARTDTEAVARARDLVACPPRCTMEIWEGSRLVRKNIWPSAPAQCA
jgi:hypothetical protein